MKKYIHIFCIFIFTIVICGSSFFSLGGTYFLLDGTVFPMLSFHFSFFSTSVFWLLHNTLNYLLGYSLYSKIFFFGTVFASGYLGILYSSLLKNILKIDKQLSIVASGGLILFLMINPFFYERMITQPGVYLSILLLGYGVYFLLKDTFSKSMRNFLYAGGFFGVALALSPHTIFMIGLILLIYNSIYVRSKKQVLGVLASFGLTLGLNINWLFGNFVLGSGYEVDSLASFGQSNIDNFLSNGLFPLGVEHTNLLLYGFWGERFHHLLSPSIANPQWYIAGLFILIIIALGLYYIYKHSYKLAVFLLLCGLASLLLGVATASPIWGSRAQMLYDYRPFYIGLREPQKWIGSLMLVYSLCFASGVIYITQVLGKYMEDKKILYGIVLFVCFGFLTAWSPHVLFGFNGQLRIGNFPKEFFELQSKVTQKDALVLIVPWHSYLECSWTQRHIISNDIDRFLPETYVVRPDNIEIGHLYTNSQSQRSKDIEGFFVTHDIELLKKYSITHILNLSQCADFKNYEFLQAMPNLTKEATTPSYELYKL